jgi:enoyl-CoA hydratase/carnithine racemase
LSSGRAQAEDLLFERRGSTALVTFNRPHARNAMTFEMYERLYERCEEVDADDGVRAMVLRGAGGKAFVAGTDIGQFRAFRSGRDGLEYEETIDRIVGRVELVRKPTMALVDGYAVGGGLAIAAACDLRVCTPEAKFGMPIARTLGNCLSMQNYARLVALIGAARVKDLVFTARTVDAEEALAIGLATEIVPAADVDERVAELCERLADHAPITLRVTKEALRRLQCAGLPDGDDLVQEAYASEDFRRAVEAFVSKSPRPGWRGS